MNRAVGTLLLIALVITAGCGDDPVQNGGEPDVEQRCSSSSECPDGEVCRDTLCRPAPSCDEITECASGENCTDGFCGYDPDVCERDRDCDREAGEICELGECREGCRNDGACDEIEICNDENVCERRPCTQVPCDDRHDCNEDTGACELKPCDGGCEPPLECREEDDVCVSCWDDDECDIAEFCADDGHCTAQACEAHEECPEGTFCIDEFCGWPPECDDDTREPNDEYGVEWTPLEEGTHTEDMISCPYNDDYYQVVADGDHSLSVDLTFSHAEGNLDLELLNTVGVTFARSASFDDNESLTVNAFKTGFYTIRVYQDGGTVAVPYDLTVSTGPPVEVAPDVCIPDGFEPNNTQAEATRLYTGRWTGLSICADEHDYFLLPAEAGDLYRVCVTPSELYSLPLGLQVLDGEGSPILSEAGTLQFCVEEDLLEGDDYVTHVFGLNAEDETAYHLELYMEPGCRLYEDIYDQNGQNDAVPGPEDPPLESLAEGTPVELMSCPNDSDYWPVPMYRRDQLSAQITFVHEDGDLQMSILRPTGTVILASQGTSDQETINYQAELNGTHYIRVYSRDRDSGAYTYTYNVTPYCVEDDLEENDASDSPAVIADAGIIEDLWRCADDDDWFSFSFAAGSTSTSVDFTVDYDDAIGTLELEVTPTGAAVEVGTGDAGSRTVEVEGTAQDLIDFSPFLIRIFAGEDDTQNTYDLTVEVQ